MSTQAQRSLERADDDSPAELDRLANLVEDCLAACRKAGASAAEVGASSERGLSVNVRMGEVETIERTRDRGLSVTVYFGQRKGMASSADAAAASLRATVEHACAIARYTEADPAAGLADPARMATSLRDLDLWHPWALEADEAIALGIACEEAGRGADPRISNSDGANVSVGASIGVYGNSHGFIGRERGTRHALSVGLIAGDDHGMQRDGWYSQARAASDLQGAYDIGRIAAERTVARLGARRLGTRECPVLFAAEVARSLLGHLVGAASGGSLYRRASFLLDGVGKSWFPTWFSLVERPFLPRGQGSTCFDAEGVATVDSDLVRDGMLSRYILGSYSARKLGLASTANAGGVHNLLVEAPTRPLSELLAELGTGLYVTDLMGQGVNLVTGDYSRGAAGFWVENGQIAFPVEEITIAGNLKDMFRGIVAVGDDVDRRSQMLCGSILLDRMMVAGE